MGEDFAQIGDWFKGVFSVDPIQRGGEDFQRIAGAWEVYICHGRKLLTGPETENRGFRA
jgi:hypothetical protein